MSRVTEADLLVLGSRIIDQAIDHAQIDGLAVVKDRVDRVCLEHLVALVGLLVCDFQDYRGFWSCHTLSTLFICSVIYDKCYFL